MSKVTEDGAAPGVVGPREINQIWVAWHLLNGFAEHRKDEKLYQLMAQVCDHLATLLEPMGADE
jgi:hypothetical protein